MMQKTIITAAVLLVVQIGLIVALNRGNSELDPATPDTLFVNFEPEKISTIEISGPDKEHITLTRSDNTWNLRENYTAPADKEQVNELLSKLASARQGLAVTTSAGSAGRLKTAADKFERHVVLKEGDATVADFYLGTSAGFRHSHVRKADEDPVYSIPISNFELGVEPDSWLDKDLAKIDREKVTKIEMDDLNLARNGDNWTLTSPEETKAAPEEVEKLLDIVTGITVQDVVDSTEAAPLFEKGVDKHFTVTLDEDKRHTYSLAKQDDFFVLKMSDSDLYFKVMAWQLEDLDGINRESLTMKNEPQEKATATTAAN